MNIKINGNPEAVEKITTIADLVAEKRLAPDRIVVEHNYRITSKEEWAGIALRENDNVEIVSFVGGG